MVPADSGHQLFVQLADEAERKRELLQPFHAVLQRGDIVADFAQVFRAALGSRTGLRGEQFAQRGLRALDAAGIDRFATDKRPNQHMGIGQPPSFAGEAPQQTIRL